MKARKSRRSLFGIHANIPAGLGRLLAILPFVLLLAVYVFASHQRHAANPNDKLLPTISQMATAAKSAAFENDKRSGKKILVEDTIASLRRLLLGVSIAALIGLIVGIKMGMLPILNASINPFVTFLSMVPPLAILPILFITFGVDELSKIILIVFGIAPLIARDIRLAVRKLPNEQIIKGLTLGASQWQLATKIILPQVLPRLIEAVRLTLGAAWLFLIAAEAIAASEGLGYRIFLVRRYLDMATILPYVLWITLLGFMIDFGLRHALNFWYPWYVRDEDAH